MYERPVGKWLRELPPSEARGPFFDERTERARKPDRLITWREVLEYVQRGRAEVQLSLFSTGDAP